ncbi:hypothetical protein Q8W71_06010 [Methylobacterium sp. NEAU 140]|uniref:hypothetical protein n=1 Tax=Methylobacterium sp. NEAU 140 TaxID=3064945 RepID=UPI0027366D58|nr:hypothetical protein [Methylobacterium sp. NEAU 140]MDP4022168.1 hypothetical protein [Methylobacterium sp. NEAU 140]
MWFGFGTTGDAVMERPLCQLVHYLVCLNVGVLVLAQIAYVGLFGGHALVSLAWVAVSAIVLAGHAACALLFAWLDGDPITMGGGFETGSGDGGGVGDGGGSDGGGSDGGAGGS